MSRTERTRLRFTEWFQGAVIDRDCRDSGCRHWDRTRWKRAARKADRLRAKQAIRRNPEEAS